MKSRLVSIGSALALSGLVACSGGSTTGGGGRLSIVLKDAPGDILSAVVSIEQIYLQGQESGGRVVLSDDAATTDLITLAADAASLVHDAVVPAGTYSELRFVISGGFIEVDEGGGNTTIYASSPTYSGLPSGASVGGSLQMPSFAQSGLKVVLPAGGLVMNGGTAQTLVVDFDVSESFGHQAGQSGKWVMHPVVRATDIRLTGSARVDLTLGAGVTLPTVSSVQVTLADFTAVFTGPDAQPRTASFADPDGDGTFSADLLFVGPGAYEVNLVPPAGMSVFTTSPPEPMTLTLVENSIVVAAFVVTAAGI